MVMSKAQCDAFNENIVEQKKVCFCLTNGICTSSIFINLFSARLSCVALPWIPHWKVGEQGSILHACLKLANKSMVWYVMSIEAKLLYIT